LIEIRKKAGTNIESSSHEAIEIFNKFVESESLAERWGQGGKQMKVQGLFATYWAKRPRDSFVWEAELDLEEECYECRETRPLVKEVRRLYSKYCGRSSLGQTARPVWMDQWLLAESRSHKRCREKFKNWRMRRYLKGNIS
jgi:hypothetical protein